MCAFDYDEAGRMAGALRAGNRGRTAACEPARHHRPVAAWRHSRPRSADNRVDVEAAIQDLSPLIGRVGFGPTTRALVDEARRRDIPVMRLDANSFVQHGFGVAQKHIRASVTGESSSLAVEAASDKSLTKTLLDNAGVPVPQGAVVRSVADALAAAGDLG